MPRDELSRIVHCQCYEASAGRNAATMSHPCDAILCYLLTLAHVHDPSLSVGRLGTREDGSDIRDVKEEHSDSPLEPSQT